MQSHMREADPNVKKIKEDRNFAIVTHSPLLEVYNLGDKVSYQER